MYHLNTAYKIEADVVHIQTQDKMTFGHHQTKAFYSGKTRQIHLMREKYDSNGVIRNHEKTIVELGIDNSVQPPMVWTVFAQNPVNSNNNSKPNSTLLHYDKLKRESHPSIELLNRRRRPTNFFLERVYPNNLADRNFASQSIAEKKLILKRQHYATDRNFQILLNKQFLLPRETALMQPKQYKFTFQLVINDKGQLDVVGASTMIPISDQDIRGILVLEDFKTYFKSYNSIRAAQIVVHYKNTGNSQKKTLVIPFNENSDNLFDWSRQFTLLGHQNLDDFKCLTTDGVSLNLGRSQKISWPSVFHANSNLLYNAHGGELILLKKTSDNLPFSVNQVASDVRLAQTYFQEKATTDDKNQNWFRPIEGGTGLILYLSDKGNITNEFAWWQGFRSIDIVSGSLNKVPVLFSPEARQQLKVTLFDSKKEGQTQNNVKMLKLYAKDLSYLHHADITAQQLLESPDDRPHEERFLTLYFGHSSNGTASTAGLTTVSIPYNQETRLRIEQEERDNNTINFDTLWERTETVEQVKATWRLFMGTRKNYNFMMQFLQLKLAIENTERTKKVIEKKQIDTFVTKFIQLCDSFPSISELAKQAMGQLYEDLPIKKFQNLMRAMANSIYLLNEESVVAQQVFESLYSKVIPRSLSIIDESDNDNEPISIGSGEPDNDNEPISIGSGEPDNDNEPVSIGSGESDNDNEPDDNTETSDRVVNRRRKREAPDLDFISRLKQPLPSTANSVHNSHIAKMLSMIWLSAKNTPFFRESAQLFFKGLLRLEFNQYNHTALQTNSEKRSASDRSVEANNGLNSKNFNVTAATTVIQNHSTPPQQLQLKPIMGNNGRTEPLMDEARSGDDWKKKRNQLNENDKHAGVVLYKTAYSSLCNSNSTSTNSNRSKNVMASLWECEGNIKSGKTDCARQNVLGVGSCDDITKDVRAQRRLLAIQKSMAPLYEQLKGVMSQQQTPYPDEKNITMSFGSLTEFDDNCHPITTKLLERGRRAAFEQVAKDSKLSKEIADKVKINPTSRTENISASVFSKPDLIDRKLHALDGRLLQDMVSSVLLNPSSDRLQLAFAHAFSENPASLSSSEVTEFIARYDKQRPEVQAQTHPMMTAGTFAQNTIEIIKSFTLMFGRTRPESTNIDEAYYNPLMKKAHHLEAWQYKSNLYAESAYLTTSIYDSVLDIVNNLDGFDHFSAHFTQKDLISFAILKHCLRQQNEEYSNSEQRIEQINEQERTRIFELFLQKVVSDSSFNPNDVITDTTEEGGLRVLPRGTWEGRLEVLKGTGNRRISSVDESGHTFFKNTSSKSGDPRDSAYFLLFLQHMLSAVNEWYFESKQRLEGKEQAIIDEAAQLFAKHNGFAKERLVEEINHSQAQAFYHEQERLNRKKSANNLPDAAKQISGAKEILKLLGKLNEQDNTEKAYEEAKLLFMQLSKADKISFIEALANDNKHYGLNYNDEWLRALSHLSATQNEAEKELLNDNLWAALGFHYSVSCQYLDSYTFNVRVTEQIRRLWQEDPLNKTADVPYDLMGELLSFIKSKLPIDISIAERIFMEKSGALSSDDQDALAYKEYLRACFQLYTYNEKKIDSILKEYFVIYKQAAQKLEALDVGGSLTIGTLTTRVLRFNNETHQQYEKETHKRTLSATSKFYQFLDTAHKQCSLLPFTVAQSEEKILTMLADAYQKLSESGSEGQQGLENLTKFYQAYQLLKELYRNNIDSSVPTEKQGEQSSSVLNVKIFELLSSVVRESFVRHPDVMVLDDLIEKEVFQCFAETTVDYNDDSSSQNSGISTDEKRRLHNNPAVARIALEYLQHLQAYGDKNEHSNDWLPDEVILKCKAIEQQLPIFFDVLRFDKMFERNNSSRFHLYGDSDIASVSSNKTQPTEDKKAQHNISEQPQNPKFRTPWQTYRVSEGVIQAIQQTPFFESILDTLKEKGYAIDEEYKIEFWTENGSGISFYHLKKEVAQYIYQQILMRREALLDPDTLKMSKEAIIQKVAVRLYLISAANKYFANYANKGMRTWIVHCFEELANALEEEDILPERTADGEEVRHLIKEKMAIPAFEKLWNDILVKANISQPCSDDLVDGIRSELRDEFSISPPTKHKIQELIESYSAKLKDRLESYQPKIQYHKYHLKKEMFTIPDGNCFYSSIGGVTGESTKQVRQNAQNHLSSLAYDKQPALRNFYQHQGYFTTEDERIRLLKQLECGFISDFCPDPDFHDYWGDSQLLPAMAYSYQRPFVLIAQSNGTVTGYEVYYPDLTIDTHYEGDENGGNDSQKTMKADMSLSNFLQRDGIALNKQDDLWPEPVIITYDDESKHYCSVIVSEKT